MTESDILRIWNGPTSQCNRAKILQFAADLESRLRAESAQEPVAERYADILEIQRKEAVGGDSYMLGLYNGMLMMCCNLDNTHYSPMSSAAPVAKPAAQEMVSVPSDLIESLPELNPMNFDEDDVRKLNDWGILVWQAADKYRATPTASMEPKTCEVSVPLEWERVTADAERYRWLRDGNNDVEGLLPALSGKELDAAIDATRGKS